MSAANSSGSEATRKRLLPAGREPHLDRRHPGYARLRAKARVDRIRIGFELGDRDLVGEVAHSLAGRSCPARALPRRARRCRRRSPGRVCLSTAPTSSPTTPPPSRIAGRMIARSSVGASGVPVISRLKFDEHEDEHRRQPQTRQRRRDPRRPRALGVWVAAEVADDRERGQRQQQDDAEGAEVRQPGEHLEDRIAVGLPEDEDDHRCDQRLRQRADVRSAVATRAPEDRGQHPGAAEGEEVARNGVVKRERSGEQAGAEQQRGDVGEERAHLDVEGDEQDRGRIGRSAVGRGEAALDQRTRVGDDVWRRPRSAASRLRRRRRAR